MAKLKAYDRNRPSSKMIDEINKRARRAATQIYEDIKQKHEEKMASRFFFMYYLALSEVLREELGFGDVRRERILEACMRKHEEINDMLIANKCVENGRESFDSDYNRELLKRLAE